MKDILTAAQECKRLIENDLTIDRVTYVNKLTKRVDMAGCITGNVSKFETALRILVDKTKSKYPRICSSLLEYIEKYDQFPIRYFGRIEALIECLIGSEENDASGHRVFISHSSKDKPLVEDFANHILMLGIGIDSNDIFCTSIEEMNIENGEDIRKTYPQEYIRVGVLNFTIVRLL